MAVTQRGAATTGANPNGVYVTATKPVGVKNGDVLVAAVVSNNQSMPAPSGWVKFEDDAIDVFRTQLFYKVAGGFEPSEYTFGNVASSSPLALTITAWTGVDTTTPIGGSVQTASLGNQSEPMTTPSVSSACTDGRVLYVRAARRADSSPGSPLTYTSSKTELTDGGIFSGGSVSYSVAVFADDEDFSSAGTKTGAAITASGAETHNVVGTVLLNAAAPALQSGPNVENPIPMVQPEGIFTATYEFDLDEDDYIENPEGGSPNTRMYYVVIPLPSGKGIARIWRPAPEDPDVTPDRTQYPATVTTIAEAVAYDAANAPAQQFVYNSEGYAVAINAQGYAHYNPESSNPGWEFQSGELGQNYAKSFVVGDLPS